MFQSRDYFPTEEEQFQVYQRMALALQGKPLTHPHPGRRGRQAPAYLTRSPEENPELGCRGVRFCLEEVGMFRTQLRAVLRAGAYGNIRMMVPLVTSLAEVRRVKELLELVVWPTGPAATPAQLSGGQKQRVALARTMVMKLKSCFWMSRCPLWME